MAAGTIENKNKDAETEPITKEFAVDSTVIYANKAGYDDLEEADKALDEISDLRHDMNNIVGNFDITLSMIEKHLRSCSCTELTDAMIDFREKTLKLLDPIKKEVVIEQGYRMDSILLGALMIKDSFAHIVLELQNVYLVQRSNGTIPEQSVSHINTQFNRLWTICRKLTALVITAAYKYNPQEL